MEHPVLKFHDWFRSLNLEKGFYSIFVTKGREVRKHFAVLDNLSSILFLLSESKLTFAYNDKKKKTKFNFQLFVKFLSPNLLKLSHIPTNI